MQQKVPDKQSSHARAAARLFAGFVARRSANPVADFEALCLAHPAEARDLQLLAAHWERIEIVLEQLGGSSSFVLSESDPATPRTEAHSHEVLRRLAGRKTASRRYDVQGEVARGGMGAILRVWDEDLRRHLAMKVVLGQTGAPAEGKTAAIESVMLGRFLEEAQITSQLEHPGIVPVHELGLDPDGRVFFTMRLVSGRDLEKIFALVRDGQEGWTQTRAVGVMLKICEAMSYAHDKGVIHRDLKPANVMVGKFGEVYVMDWGLARVVGKEEQKPVREKYKEPETSIVSTDRLDLRHSGTSSAQNTMDGDIVGTPSYMSPEQARGDLAAMGPASDVYSTGAILYHLLAGHSPYSPTGTQPTLIEVWERARKESPEPLHERAPEAPAELIAICEKAMAREPSQRYAGMVEFAEDLRAYLEGRVVHAYETGAVAEFKKWVVRNKGLAITTMVALFVIIAGTTVWSLVLADKNKELGAANKASHESELAAKQSQAIAEERATRILRLSDVKRLSDLMKQADSLWPAHPERIPELEEWLIKARDLLSRLPQHRTALAQLRQGAQVNANPVDAVASTWTFARDEDAWQHGLQAELVANLESFEDPARGRVADVAKRLEFARTIEPLTISGEAARALWTSAIESIASSPKYHGLSIRSQLGLLPIGPDRASGLWEFAHLQTGDPAVRDPDTGELQLTEQTGLVFVLIPDGTFEMGAQSADESEANYVPEAEVDEQPVTEVTLGPYFLSKYEMTQGQWLRIAGSNPSIYGVDRMDQFRATLLHPVEQVSWDECAELLGRMALRLPTEAQWEFGARGGTQTRWWTGDEKLSLEGACNIGDLSAREAGAPWPNLDDEIEDGYAVHAPCNTLLPNPFGLYHVHGNVWEWCRDSYCKNYDVKAEPGDGERAGDEKNRVNRGGSFLHPADKTRSANRGFSPPSQRANHLGLRPSRALVVR